MTLVYVPVVLFLLFVVGLLACHIRGTKLHPGATPSAFRGLCGLYLALLVLMTSCLPNATTPQPAPDAHLHEDARGYWETVMGKLTLDEYPGKIYYYDWYAIEITPEGQAVVTWDNGLACSRTEARVQGKEIRLVAGDVESMFVIHDAQHATVTFRRGGQVYVKLLVKTRDDPRVICS